MNTETITTAPCPICFKDMQREADSYHCAQHGDCPACPVCGGVVELQQADNYRCANCPQWFNGKLEKI